MIAFAKPHLKPHTRCGSAKDSGHRFYSPEISRWLNRDPIGDVGGIHLYAFVANQPVDNVDFIGLLYACGCCCVMNLEKVLDHELNFPPQNETGWFTHGNVVRWDITLGYKVASGMSAAGFQDCTISVGEAFSADSTVTTSYPNPTIPDGPPVVPAPGTGVDISPQVSAMPFWQNRSRLIFDIETVTYEDVPRIEGTSPDTVQRDMLITIIVASGAGCEGPDCEEQRTTYRQRIKVSNGVRVPW